METYCGKNCEFCNEKELTNCPGCKAGPGRSLYDGCEIAACCKSKGHQTCETCTLKGGCGKRNRRDGMPKERRRKAEAAAARKAEIARKTPILSRWLWILFWLIVPNIVAGLMSNDTVAGWFPGLRVPGEVLGMLVSLAYGLILLKLSSEERCYRTAGICMLVMAVVDLPMILAPGVDRAGTLLLAVVGLIVGLVGEYHEYIGHSEVLCEMDVNFSEKWKSLWKWYIAVTLGTFAGVVVMLIFPLLGALVTLAAAIGLIVVSIMKLVYLYRTAKLFRDYPVEC